MKTPAKTADTKTSAVGTQTRQAPPSDPTIGLICIGFMVALVVLLVWGVRRTLKSRTRSDADDAAPPAKEIKRPPKKRFYEKEMSAYRYSECSTCTVRIRPGDRIYWDKYDKRARHADCLAAIAISDAKEEKEHAARRDAAFTKLLDRLAGAKGTATREALVQRARQLDLSDEQRLQILIEASAHEVDDVIEKVEALKSKTVRRRRLQESLARLRADAVPDELQADQIRIVEEALQKVEAEPEK